MHVTQIWRYPVKSIAGERIEAADIGEFGISGDRGWGVRDVTTGMVLTARRAPLLLFASAHIDDAGEVVIAVPDHGDVREGSVGDAALSDWLGLEVQLSRAGDAGGTYENPTNVQDEDDWMTWQGPPNAWHDSARSRVSLVSESTLRDWDIRRFRSNIVLSGAGEDDFVDTTVQLGTCALDVTNRISRCIMVTRPQPGLDRDLDVLQTIHRERGSCLSVGALISRPGVVAVGDAVR